LENMLVTHPSRAPGHFPLNSCTRARANSILRLATKPLVTSANLNLA